MELKSRSFTSKEPHVAREPQVADPWARSNTSLVALRVVEGEGKRSLESETVKYVHEPHWTRIRK
jgi:hypothetical protein